MMNLLGFPMLVLKIYIGMSPSPEHIISMMNLLGLPMLVLKIYIGMSPSPEHIISMMNCFNSGLWSPE
jgi:hypothetical protein